MDLKKLTHKYLSKYKRRLSTAYEINDGDCHRWSVLANKLYGGNLVTVDVYISWDEDMSFTRDCSHSFLKLNDKYYDSESPDGVDNWKNLRFFQSYESEAYCEHMYEVTLHKTLKSHDKVWKPTKQMKKADSSLLKELGNNMQTYKELVAECVDFVLNKLSEYIKYDIDWLEARGDEVSVKSFDDYKSNQPVFWDHLTEYNHFFYFFKEKYKNGLFHDDAMFFIKNSDNIHHSIDGRYRKYRKDNYIEIAIAAFEGDVMIEICNKLGIEYDINDIFDRRYL